MEIWELSRCRRRTHHNVVASEAVPVTGKRADLRPSEGRPDTVIRHQLVLLLVEHRQNFMREELKKPETNRLRRHCRSCRGARLG